MGCSASKLDDEEVVQLCKDRKKFIRQAVEQRMKFASGHIAYIQAMRRVSAALREYIDGDEPREFLLDSFSTPTFTPMKKTSPGFITMSPDSFTVTPFKPETNPSYKVHCYRSGGNPSVFVEERPPQSPDTYRVEAYPPLHHHHYGTDSMFGMQSAPMTSSFFQYSPNNRPNYPPPSSSPSPSTSQWDFFWNPFSSLDYYGYPSRSNLDNVMLDDENAGLQQVREAEGIPDLEEETEYEEIDERVNMKEESGKTGMNFEKEEVVMEDVDSDDDCDCDDDAEMISGQKTEKRVQELSPLHECENIELAKSQSVRQMSKRETAVADRESKEEMPGFTVYVNKRPTSMTEVIKDLEEQFSIACKAAGEMSSILEASRAKFLSSNNLTGINMLNPVALFRSASSRSSSSRILLSNPISRDENYESSSSDFSEDSCILSGSHQSTLDRLYTWESKLYQEVRASEHVRIAYEKKCMQLKNRCIKGDDPSLLDKTGASLRDLDTRIKVSIHTIECVSKRIETLRDEELEPQLLELVQGFTKMWKVMAECHQLQKHTLEEAKILLAGMPSKLPGTKKYTIMSPSEPHKLARSAANLERELKNWRACFYSWIVSQRSYARALAGWLMRCICPDVDASKPPFSPHHHSSGAPPLFNMCIQWSRLLDAINEAQVLDGMDFFTAGVGSLYAHQLREDSRRLSSGGSKRFGGGEVVGRGNNMEVVEAGHFEDEFMTAEKMADVAIRVVCAGMSVAISALTEFAVSSAEGYADLLKEWERGNQQQSLEANESR